MRCKDCKYREECKPKIDKFLGRKHADVLIAMGMCCCFPEERRIKNEQRNGRNQAVHRLREYFRSFS